MIKRNITTAIYIVNDLLAAKLNNHDNLSLFHITIQIIDSNIGFSIIIGDNVFARQSKIKENKDLLKKKYNLEQGLYLH